MTFLFALYEKFEYTIHMSMNSSDENAEGLGLWNKVAEQSEQQREEAAQALASIKRTQKDEKKAHRYDVWLSELVKTLLQNQVYDHIISQLVPLLNARCPSHILLAYILPLSDDILLKVRSELIMNEAMIPIKTPFTERVTYQEPLDGTIAKHLNIWMDTVRGCLTIDPSQTSTKKIQEMINTTYEEWLVKLVAHTLVHFLYDRGVNIQPADAARVARGIIKKMLLLVQWIQVEEFFVTPIEEMIRE